MVRAILLNEFFAEEDIDSLAIVRPRCLLDRFLGPIQGGKNGVQNVTRL